MCLGPAGRGGERCVSGASDQQEELSQSGASVWFGDSLPCRQAKGESSKAKVSLSDFTQA